MKFLLIAFLAITCAVQHAYGQHEELSPLGWNSSILSPPVLKAGPLTFDSTFAYFPDTLQLPFLDEFSKDHFQKYDADFNDPGVTSVKQYKLLDTDDNPLPADAVYSNVATFRKQVNAAQNITTNVPLEPESIKVGNFASYPTQYATTTVYPAYTIYDTLDLPGDLSDTIWMMNPFYVQDSATKFFAPLHDPDRYWLDNYAYHNYRFAVKPWTLGVVTFDGLDENGYPYSFGSTSSGNADVLTSKPINMSAVSAADSVYFSFLYQPEGFGDTPESADSLIVEFYAPAQQQWFRVWSVAGSPLTDFKKVHFRVIDNKYFHSAFQFRFRNYGGLSGSLDHFHVDYVMLRPFSGYQDTLFKDFAFVYQLGSLLKDYTSVPWDHYKNNFTGKMTDAARITVRNGSNIPENYQDGEVNISYNGTIEGSFNLVGQTLAGNAINYAPRTVYESFHDFSTGYRFDENKPGDEQVFDLEANARAQFTNLTVNDSAYGQQVFSNYYAYDDGSAEQAYGTTGIQSRLAYQFTPYEADSLIGVKMHFVPTVKDVSNNLFLLTVWADNGGKPGAVLYEDNFFFPREPVYEGERNKFTNYYLKDTMKLPITGTFYVGWRQLEADKLSIGFDRNTINSDKIFYSVNNGTTWPNTSFEGSLMIRPIFSTALDATLGIEEKEIAANVFEVYPNPVNETLYLRADPSVYEGALLFDIQGKLIGRAEKDQLQLDLSTCRPGVYIVRDIHSGISRKIIRN